MKIKLTEEQIKNLLEVEIQYNENLLPKLIEDINKDIIDCNKVCVKFYNILKSLNVNDIILNGTDHIKKIDLMKKNHEVFLKKSNYYFKILNTFDNDYDNDVLQEFDELNSKLDVLQDDMDTIVTIYNDIVDSIIDYDGTTKDKIKNFDKRYQGDVIDI